MRLRRPNDLQLVLIYLLVIAVCAVMMTVKAYAHVEGHPEWSPWFNEQIVPDGSYAKCCDHADVYLIDENDLQQTASGDSEVKIEGFWYIFPNHGLGKPGNTVMTDTGNPTGHMLAWLYRGQPRCLMGASGT